MRSEGKSEPAPESSVEARDAASRRRTHTGPDAGEPLLEWCRAIVHLAERIARHVADTHVATPAELSADGCPTAAAHVMSRTAGWVRRLAAGRLLHDRGQPPSLLDRIAPGGRALPPLPRDLAEGGAREILPPCSPTAPIDWLGAAHETLATLAWTDGSLVARPAPRKRSGLFFTPPEVTTLMVDRLCASLAEETPLTRERIGSLRLIDPACGSGAFLVAAYRKLLAAAAATARRRRPARLAERRVVEHGGGLRRRLLESCLHGIDIDPAAVELARCNLALAYLDAGGEPAALPAMNRSLRVADALLAAGRTGAPKGAAALVETASRAGFDAVICNPPYRFGENIDHETKSTMRRTFHCASARQWDTWALFLELGLRRLLRPRGTYCYIVPDALLARRQASVVRETLLRHGPPHEIWHLGPVFRGAAVAPFRGAPSGPDKSSAARVTRSTAGVSAVVILGRETIQPDRARARSRASGDRPSKMPYALVRADPWLRFLLALEDPLEQECWRIICRRSDPLDRYLVAPGIGRGEERAKRDLPEAPTERHTIPVLGGGEALRPFRIAPRRRFVDRLTPSKRCHYGGAARLLAAKTGERLVVARAPCDTELAFLQTIYALHVQATDLAFLEGWLNSGRLNWVIRVTITAYKRLMPQLTQDEIRTLPVPRLPQEVRDDIARIVEHARAAPAEGLAARLGEIDLRISRALGLGASPAASGRAAR